MAHIFSLASPAPAAYHEGKKSNDQVKFPGTGFFQGINEPSRLEADIFELETTGTVSLPFKNTQHDLSSFRFQKTLTALFSEYNQTTAFRLCLKKTYISTAMARYLLSSFRTVMSISDSAMCIPIASRQKQKRAVRC